MLLGSAGKGVYGEAIPDFMVWNQVYQLPLFWKPYRSVLFAVLSAILLPALLAALIGLVTFRRRLRGTYFAILTQAIAFAVWLMLNRNEMRLGGTNGLTDFKSILGLLPGRSAHAPGALRGDGAGAAGSPCWRSRWLVRSKTGLVLEAIRDNERRLEFLGYDTARFKILAFAIAAMFAGRGRAALRAPGRHHHAEPGRRAALARGGHLGRLRGRGTLWGAVLGAVSINWLRSVLTATLSDALADHPRRPVRGGGHALPRGADGPGPPRGWLRAAAAGAAGGRGAAGRARASASRAPEPWTPCSTSRISPSRSTGSWPSAS